jgi:hypothetical protein
MVPEVTSLPVRQFALGVMFLGAILLVVALDRRRPTALWGGAAAPGFSLKDVARDVASISCDARRTSAAARAARGSGTATVAVAQTTTRSVAQ